LREKHKNESLSEVIKERPRDTYLTTPFPQCKPKQLNNVLVFNNPKDFRDFHFLILSKKENISQGI